MRFIPSFVALCFGMIMGLTLTVIGVLTGVVVLIG